MAGRKRDSSSLDDTPEPESFPEPETRQAGGMIEIWVEGLKTREVHNQAKLLKTMQSEGSFNLTVAKFAETRAGAGVWLAKSGVWHAGPCRLFETEDEARKSYG